MMAFCVLFMELRIKLGRDQDRKLESEHKNNVAPERSSTRSCLRVEPDTGQPVI